MEIKNTILHDKIKELGITYTEFAYHLGVTEQSVRLWLNGKRRPSMSTLVAMQRFFDEKQCNVDVIDVFANQ